MKNLVLASMLILPISVLAEEPKEDWDVVTKAVWGTFQYTPHMIDSCALKIAHKVSIDRKTGWPAYCNKYEETETVKNRVIELEKAISVLDIPKDQYEKIRNGEIWINAPREYVVLALGIPVDTSKSTTAAGVKETWEYKTRAGSFYVFMENGLVVEIRE
jgi:hypothetical protein